MKPQVIDMAGKRYGYLVVLEFVETGKRNAHWLCRCDCGKEKVIAGRCLREGKTVSCRCKKKGLRHGHCPSGKPTPEYRSWNKMKDRCLNPANEAYADYGGRGITICERWLKFDNFLADMGSRPSGTTLERVNNKKGYMPSNCKWGTRLEQNNNSRWNTRITYRGRTQTIAQWARELSIPSNRISKRLGEGWSVEKTLSTPAVGPSARHQRLIEFRGHSKNVAGWSRELGIEARRISARLSRGWTVERALTTPNNARP